MFHVRIVGQQLVEYIRQEILPADTCVDLLFAVDILIDAGIESIAVAWNRNESLIVEGTRKTWCGQRIVVIQQ